MKVVAKRKIKYPIALERTWAKEIVSHVAALMNVVKSYAPRMGRTLLSMAAVFDADDGEPEDELSAMMDDMGEEVDSLPSMRPQAEKMYDRVDRHAYMELAAVFDAVFGTRPVSLSREPFPPVYGASVPQGAGSAFQSARESGGFAKMMTNEAQLDQLKRIWVQENLDLIKSIDAETLRKIRETMADMILGTVDRAELTRDLQRGLVPVIFKKPLEEITRRERNRAALIGRDQVGKLNGRLTEYYQRQAGIEEYEWSTAGDERVRPSHRALEGKIYKWNSPPPEGHPGQPIQCRCIADPIIDIDKIGMAPKKGSYEEENPTPEEGLSPAGVEIIKQLDALGIETHSFRKFDEPISASGIISRISGGDMTKGSCSSTAFCYAGNKAGFDVLDFRGGDSTAFFAKTGNIEKIAKLPGVSSFIVRQGNDFTAVKNLIPNVKEGKEYILAVGKHSAIIRKTSSGFEFLELQAPVSNGWFKLNYEKLQKRFGCQKSYTLAGQKVELKNILIDVDSLSKSKDFEKIIEYINTPKGKQMKGAAGSVK